MIYRGRLHKKYKGSPVIRLMVISAAEPCENFLKTPYEGGYPDKKPESITMNQCNGRESTRSKVLISLKATCNELYKFLKKIHSNKPIELLYETDMYDSAEHPLPNADSLLKENNIRQQSILKLNIKEIEENKEEKPKEKFEFPILQEEIFEEVGDDYIEGIDEDIAKEIKEEEKKKEKEKEEMNRLKKEFEKKYKEYKEVRREEFTPLKVSDVVRNLEELLNSYETV